MTRTARRLEWDPKGGAWPYCVERAQLKANGLSARYYGCPVYLVGGALTSPNPRDVDIVIPIANDLFVAMYGDASKGHLRLTEEKLVEVIQTEFFGGWWDANPLWRRWARDCAKQGRLLTLECGRAVDFKTQPALEFDRYQDRPRIRLDDELLDEFAT